MDTATLCGVVVARAQEHQPVTREVLDLCPIRLCDQPQVVQVVDVGVGWQGMGNLFSTNARLHAGVPLELFSETELGLYVVNL